VGTAHATAVARLSGAWTFWEGRGLISSDAVETEKIFTEDGNKSFEHLGDPRVIEERSPTLVPPGARAGCRRCDPAPPGGAGQQGQCFAEQGIAAEAPQSATPLGGCCRGCRRWPGSPQIRQFPTDLLRQGLPVCPRPSQHRLWPLGWGPASNSGQARGGGLAVGGGTQSDFGNRQPEGVRPAGAPRSAWSSFPA